MKRITLASLALAALTGLAAGQASTSNQNAQGTSQISSSSAAESETQIPAGTAISAEISKSVNVKKVKAGDKVVAKTSMDLLSQGKVVIPRNTKILGHITEAKAHSKESPGSTLGITFDSIAMKDGRELPVRAAIQAIGRPLQAMATDSTPPAATGGLPSAPSPMPSAGGMGGSRASVPDASYPGGASSSTSDTTAPASGPAPLGPTSKGVVGIKGLEIKSAGTTSVITSATENVQLESGTQLILKTE